MIQINGKTLHLIGKNISYVMYINAEGDLINYHFGKKIAAMDYSANAHDIFEPFGYTSNVRSLDVYPQEYPSYGHSDLREGAYRIVGKSGSEISELHFREYRIIDGCVQTDGMPCLFSSDKSQGKTVEITLEDNAVGLRVKLYYTVFEDQDIIARHAVIENISDCDMTLDYAYSANLDLPVGDYDTVYFTGAWGRERYMRRTSPEIGMRLEIDNARGGSGHQVSPFVMVCQKGADETHGDVYGFSLIYSGNHSTSVETDQFGMLRVRQGINPFTFETVLSPNCRFTTPQSVLCYSSDGFEHISNEYHDTYKAHLMRSKWLNRTRPLLLNNWEGTYFDFTEEKLLDMAKTAKSLGLELFVLDDGWFGTRNDDKSSLGDWYVNLLKLPSGIKGLSKKINSLGLMFGIWIEPEMVSADSVLYRAHPDWIISTPEREPVEARNQFILDLSRDEVCEYVINAISDVLNSANIEYVKWDMNRQMADMPYRGYNHKYILGYYRIMSEITSRFPDVLFEGCSAGGGRFDPGVLAYMPQIWTSDNSDACARLKIQYSTSMFAPIYSISTHVTASPNHQTGRITTLKTRADCAYMGTFGYELDVTKMSEEDLGEIKKQVEYDKSIRELVRDGDFHRLLNPYTSNYCAWSVTSGDKKRALLFACKVLSVTNSKNKRIKLRGLNPDAMYRNSLTDEIFSGDMLMYKGFKAEYANHDFASIFVEFSEIAE